MSTPVTRRRENTRARLRDAAGQLFAEIGFEAASVEAICERAGFTRGAFYSNFETKDELFLELASAHAEARLTSVRARIDELVASGSLAGGADLASLVERVMYAGDDDRLTVLLMVEIQRHALRDAAFAAAFAAQGQAMFASVEAVVAAVVDSGAFILRLDVSAAARMLLTVWEGSLVRAALEGADDDRLSAAANAALVQLVELLVAPAPTR